MVPAVDSIAPPARLALFPENVERSAVKFAPLPTRIAPPLPLAPLATLLVMDELFKITFAPTTCIAPPLSACPLVSVKSFITSDPAFTSKIRPLAFPLMVVIVSPLPVKINDLSIVI